MNKIIFFTSLLVTNIVSSFGYETLFYNVTITRKNVLEPSFIDITTKLNFIHQLTATSDNNLTYQTAILNPIFDIYRDGIQILNVDKCESFALKKELLQPFLILYNEDQTFKAIKTRKDESELVKNTKLLISSVTQVDASKLNETKTEVKTQAEEVLPSGKCKVDYDAKRIQSLPGLNLQLHKDYDAKKCTRKPNKQAEEDVNYLKKICNSETESNFEEQVNADLKIVFESVSGFVTNINLTNDNQFKPLKNKDAKITLDMDFKADILTRNNTAVEKFDDTDTIEISQRTYRPVNRSLLKNNSKVDPKLQKLFKSLACKASVKNSHYDIMERIVTCLSNHNLPKK